MLPALKCKICVKLILGSSYLTHTHTTHTYLLGRRGRIMGDRAEPEMEWRLREDMVAPQDRTLDFTYIDVFVFVKFDFCAHAVQRRACNNDKMTTHNVLRTASPHCI